jgi:CBS domain-containing protein
MSDFPLARILDFVRTISPFDTLDPDELNKLVRRMDIAYFPRDPRWCNRAATLPIFST